MRFFASLAIVSLLSAPLVAQGPKQPPSAQRQAPSAQRRNVGPKGVARPQAASRRWWR